MANINGIISIYLSGGAAFKDSLLAEVSTVDQNRYNEHCKSFFSFQNPVVSELVSFSENRILCAQVIAW